MRTKFFLLLAVFIIVISGVLIFRKQIISSEQTRRDDTNDLCKYEEGENVFSKKHYFSKEEATQLFGKKVRNLKCGKLKCPISSNDCVNVQVNEFGKITGLKPRAGFDDYTLIIEWDEPRKKEDFSLAEQGGNNYVTFVGNDASYQILE